jgi:hypothetical protein
MCKRGKERYEADTGKEERGKTRRYESHDFPLNLNGRFLQINNKKRNPSFECDSSVIGSLYYSEVYAI